ncbi:helix-turn-helix transcriptional regulator [Pantoea sp. Acro-835]|uniref:Helix-turn-helix transcriptional regulator n=2 Tax=Candidatus Pantoea multigeneris TaxID=2608357 RepID=A0ABX0R4F2_9GAMM|nr:helix-turn-helix transcriptional regulator [Pantoea multigeneris]NIF20287.1 helix-turn-helix transcriptional regulator [Pantoea multigeneris]
MRTPLRVMREAKGLTISEVALAVQIDVGNLSRIERGIQVTSIETAEKIADFFNRKISEMQILYPHRYAEGHKADQ